MFKFNTLRKLLSLCCEAAFLVIWKARLRYKHRPFPVLVYPTPVWIVKWKLTVHYPCGHWEPSHKLMKFLFNFNYVTGYFHSLVYLFIPLIWTWLVHPPRHSLVPWALNNPRNNEPTQPVASKLAPLIVESRVDHPAAGTSFWLPYFVIS
jgi:hypothetical protein